MKHLIVGCVLVMGLSSTGCSDRSPAPQTVTVFPVTQQLDSAATLADGQSAPLLILSNNNGWLVAMTSGSALHPRMQVVLARIDHRLQPEITVGPTGASFHVTYGRYFIRSSPDCLRVVRERKRLDADDWGVIGRLPEGRSIYQDRQLAMVDGDAGPWLAVMPQPDSPRVDAVVHLGPDAVGWEVCSDSSPEDGANARCDRSWCYDDGEMLIVRHWPAKTITRDRGVSSAARNVAPLVVHDELFALGSGSPPAPEDRR